MLSNPVVGILAFLVLAMMPGMAGSAGAFGEGASSGAGAGLTFAQARQGGSHTSGGFPWGDTGPGGQSGQSFFRGHEPLAPHPAWQVQGGGHGGPAAFHPVPSRPVLPHQQGPFFEDGRRGRFHSRPSHRAPLRIPSYRFYTIEPRYLPGYGPEPYGQEPPAPGGVVHRGEGSGAAVYRPDRDHAPEDGEGLGEALVRRGVAYPRVARVLEHNAVGEPSTWTDARTGAETTVTPTRDLHGEEPCREFRHTVAMAAGELEALGVACRTREGTWELLP